MAGRARGALRVRRAIRAAASSSPASSVCAPLGVHASSHARAPPRCPRRQLSASAQDRVSSACGRVADHQLLQLGAGPALMPGLALISSIRSSPPRLGPSAWRATISARAIAATAATLSDSAPPHGGSHLLALGSTSSGKPARSAPGRRRGAGLGSWALRRERPGQPAARVSLTSARQRLSEPSHARPPPSAERIGAAGLRHDRAPSGRGRCERSCRRAGIFDPVQVEQGGAWLGPALRPDGDRPRPEPRVRRRPERRSTSSPPRPRRPGGKEGSAVQPRGPSPARPDPRPR